MGAQPDSDGTPQDMGTISNNPNDMYGGQQQDALANMSNYGMAMGNKMGGQPESNIGQAFMDGAITGLHSGMNKPREPGQINWDKTQAPIYGVPAIDLTQPNAAGNLKRLG